MVAVMLMDTGFPLTEIPAPINPPVLAMTLVFPMADDCGAWSGMVITRQLSLTSVFMLFFLVFVELSGSFHTTNGHTKQASVHPDYADTPA